MCFWMLHPFLGVAPVRENWFLVPLNLASGCQRGGMCQVLVFAWQQFSLWTRSGRRVRASQSQNENCWWPRGEYGLFWRSGCRVLAGWVGGLAWLPWHGELG